jgi:negative regulator of flagellin synthesis FlgM
MADPIRGVNPIDVSGLAPADQPGSPPASAESEQPGAVIPVDTADLTRAEALLSAISLASANVPSVNQSRIAELQQALNSGTYQANPQLIAQKIVEIEGLLSSRSSGG